MIEFGGLQYLSEKEMAKRFGYSCSWFQKARIKKIGPPFVRFHNKGKILYRADKAETYFTENWIEKDEY